MRIVNIRESTASIASEVRNAPAWRAPVRPQHRRGARAGRQRILSPRLCALRRICGRHPHPKQPVALPEIPGIGFEDKADLMDLFHRHFA